MTLTPVLLLALALGILTWRLGQGGMEAQWLASRLEESLNAGGGPTKFTIARLALAWDGFQRGLDRPLDLRLEGVAVSGPDGRNLLEIERAAVSLSIRGLLTGQFLPRAIALDRPRLTLMRARDGTISLNLGTLLESSDVPGLENTGGAAPKTGDMAPRQAALAPAAAWPAEFALPASNDFLGRLGITSQLRRVRAHDAVVSIADQWLGSAWSASITDLDVARRAAGGLDGTAAGVVSLGEQRIDVTLTLASHTTGPGFSFALRTPRITPAALAAAAPKLAMLAAVDAPIKLEAGGSLDGQLDLVDGRAELTADAGVAHIGTGTLAFERADIDTSFTPSTLVVRRAQITARGHPGGSPTTVTVSGNARKERDRVFADIKVSLDQADFADMPRLWPEGIAVHPRDWVTTNISGGTARNGQAAVTLDAAADLSSVTMTHASATLDGDDVTVSWLRPITPLDRGKARLHLLDPDTMEITVETARQRVAGSSGDLILRGGRMRIIGLSMKDQTAKIEADIAGPLASAISLLREPKLRLLDRRPIELNAPSGDMTGKLTIALPLETWVGIDDIAIQVAAKLNQVHLGGLVAGRDIDRGQFDLTATNDELTVKGDTLVAGIQARIEGVMSFKGGPASAERQRITANGRPTAAQLTATGLDSFGVLTGELGMQAVYTERGGGNADLTVNADFTSTAVAVQPLAWQKPPGAAVHGGARVILKNNRMVSIEAIAAEGSGLDLRAAASLTDGKIAAVRLDRLVLGQSDVRGTVQFPPRGPIAMDLTGPRLDMGPKLTEPRTKRDKTKPEPPPDPPWTLDGRFERVLLARGQAATNVKVNVTHDGRVTRSLSVSGGIGGAAGGAIGGAAGGAIGAAAGVATAGGSAPFTMTIAPNSPTSRLLTVTAADGGAWLRGLDLVASVEGGRLSAKGNYDDTTPEHILSATAEMEDFRVRGAMALGKLLQAMTFYGLVDVMSGSGLNFYRLVAPFQLDDDGLLLKDARAFSSSLGLTAKGRIDPNGERLDIEGTIVPAYFFNSLLGQIPLIGKLFSPEKGGGLFAARYTLRGLASDPSVFVNPLSVVTPGFLREVFGIF